MLAYNHAPYIRTSIKSILQQRTSFPLELIIAEDCSKDDTRKIAIEYQQSHPEIVRVVTSDMNVGAHENLRRAEHACRGRYVAFCEGDDYWHVPHKLQRQVDFLEAHPDYAMVHSDYRTYYVESGQLVPKSLSLAQDLNDENAFNDILSGRRIILTLTTCVRRSVLEAVLRDCPECYDTRFLMGDTQRWLEIARRGKVKWLPDVLATRHVISESATRSRNAARVLQFSLSAKDVLDHYICKYGCSPEAKRGAKTRSAIYLLSCAYEAGNAQTARAALNEYHRVGVPIPLEAHLYYHGSRTPVLRKLVRPALAAIKLWQKILRRLGCLMKLA
jgi:glycosyltransferase involved in cell wall biosynthesis